MNSTRSISSRYSLLEGAERFAAVLEAMTRGDAVEEERLEESCPQGTYEIDSPDYRQRMSMSFTAAAIACSSILRNLEVIRVLGVMKDMTRLYEHSVGDAVEDAFFDGWRACAERHKIKALEEDFDSLEESIQKLRDLAEKNAAIPKKAVTGGVADCRATRVVSAWERFGRFCRECCSVEPQVLTRAWRLLSTDPEQEVRKLYPDIGVEKEAADGWYASLATAWRHRCGDEG